MTPQRIRTVLGICLVLISVIVLHYAGALAWLDTAFRHATFRPIRTLYSRVAGDRDPDNANASIHAADSTGTQALAFLQARLLLLEAENSELRQQLRYLSQIGYRHIGADVVGKSIDPVGNVIIINRGAKDDISIGSPVIIGQGVIVGKIIRVEKDSAQVALINDPGSKLAATVINKEKSMGLVEGGFGISVRMNFIPQNEIIHVGDMIVTSGLEQRIPRGLLIGIAEAVEKEAYQPFQQAVITPIATLDRLTVVSVLLPL